MSLPILAPEVMSLSCHGTLGADQISMVFTIEFGGLLDYHRNNVISNSFLSQFLSMKNSWAVLVWAWHLFIQHCGTEIPAGTTNIVIFEENVFDSLRQLVSVMYVW